MIRLRARGVRVRLCALMWFGACVVSPAGAGAQPGHVGDLFDRLAGKGVPDFTLVYACERHSALQGATRAQVQAQVAAWGDRYAREWPGKPLPPDFVTQRTDEFMRQARWDTQVTRVVLSIATRGDRLLVTKELPQRHETSVFLYDGTRTLVTVLGRDAQVYPGFQYTHLRDFVFPGFGMCGIPMARELSRVPASSDTYSGSLAWNGGAAGPSGLPAYRPGRLRTRLVAGAECVVSAEVGGWIGYPTSVQEHLKDHPLPAQRSAYSDY